MDTSNSPFAISQQEIDKLLNLEEINDIDIEKNEKQNEEIGFNNQREDSNAIENILIGLKKELNQELTFLSKEYHQKTISEFSFTNANAFDNSLIIEINYFLPERIYFFFDISEFEQFLGGNQDFKERAKNIAISTINSLLKEKFQLENKNLFPNTYTDLSFLPQDESFNFLSLKIKNEDEANLNLIVIFSSKFFSVQLDHSDENKKIINKGEDNMSEDIDNFLDSVESEDSVLSTPKKFSSNKPKSKTSDVNIQKAAFQNFNDNENSESSESNNIEMLMDIPMEVSVELGRVKKKVEEILMLNEGSIIELNRIAGEPVDLFVNGKLLAKGEVIVIEENFGIRITEIISFKDRLKMYDL